MNTSHVSNLFSGIDDYTKERIVRNLKPQLAKALRDVNTHLVTHCKKMGKPVSVELMSPQPGQIMEAFRRCSLQRVRVVVVAQDPFINPGEATGLCFSVPPGVKIPPSTRNMYACLEHSGFLKTTPNHGDLSHWADQGVLMLNCALTTVLGTSNAHADAWAEYTDGIIKQICELPQRVIFILLGGFAQKKAKLISHRHIKLMWGHPSPVNNANKSDNPRHFKYCDVFTKTNQHLVTAGDTPIMFGDTMPTISKLPTVAIDDDDTVVVTFSDVATDTSSAAGANAAPYVHSTVYPGTYTSGQVAVTDPAGAKNTLFIFTDGGAIANGEPQCEASWGFYMTDGVYTARASGRVEPKFLPGCKFQASNNRGELMAILHALEYLLGHYAAGGVVPAFTYNNIMIISDSKYSIEGIEHRDLNGKMNVDLIGPAKDYVAQLRKRGPVKFNHVHSHRSAPEGAVERFYWLGNDVVDKLCNAVLGLDDNKKRI